MSRVRTIVNRIIGLRLGSLMWLAVLFVFVLNSSPALAEDKLHPFKIGEHVIDGNVIRFEFPSSTLYLLNVEPWKTPIAFRKMEVQLFDKNRRLVSFSDSSCVRKAIGHFGSFGFPGVTRDNIKEVAYFRIVLESCQ